MEKGFARTAPALSFAMQEYYEYLLVVHPAPDVYALMRLIRVLEGACKLLPKRAAILILVTWCFIVY